MHESLRVFEAKFRFKLVVLGRKCGQVVSATWRQTRYATKQANGDFLLAVKTKTKFNQLLLLVLDESSKVCIFVQSMMSEAC